MSFRDPRPPSSRSLLVLGLGVALLLLGGRGEDGERDDAGEPDDRRLPARVIRVLDGDTARMVIAGREQSVRYIGIDTPESAIPGERPECFGKRAGRLNRRLLAGGAVTVELGAERRDAYDRLLAYVHAGGSFLNAELVRRGFARTLAIAPNTRYASAFARLQQRAANAGRGLWGAC